MTTEEFFKKHFNDEYEDVLGIEFKEDLLNVVKTELIKYEAHQRIDRATHIKEFEFAEQAVDNYLNPPTK